MANIKQITLLDGVTYDIVDAGARELIEELQAYTDYLGVTTTELTDGATTNPITINSKSVTAVKGNIVNYGSKEFIFNGTAWQEFGDLSALGDLAYKDDASATYTPAGTVSQPTFSGSELTSTGSFTPAGGVEISLGSGSANYTPSGSVSQPTFSGSELTSTGSFTPSGSVAISVGSGTANYTPAGSVSQPTFSGSELTSTGSFTPSGSVTITQEETGTANYTPAGTVSTPTITVTPATDSVYSITDVGSLPSLTMTVDANENLTISFAQGTLPTKGSAQTVVSGITSATSSQPTFTGTGAVLGASFSGTAGSVSVAGTPEGTVSQPSFSGTAVDLEAGFTGTSGSVSVTGTPAGTVSQPTFSGTGVDLEAAFTGTAGSVSVTGTPAGTVSQPTFSGTEATITVS